LGSPARADDSSANDGDFFDWLVVGHNHFSFNL
jgi:hypothetical protein